MVAPTAQTVRNAVQKDLGYTARTLVATSVRFVYGPFALAGKSLSAPNAAFVWCVAGSALAQLPAQAHAADIVWRLLLCGIGFGLFQTPNNRTMIGSAPPYRRGGASGMQATARVCGQVLGAAFMALAFHLFDERGATAALWAAALFALLAGGASLMRLGRGAPGGEQASP